MSRSSLRRTDPGDRSDAVLELRFPETFETFYSRELPSLVAFAGALSGSAYADDIAQEAMLAAYRHWDDVSRLDAPVAWVRRVCANRAVSTLRRRAVEARAMIRLGSRRPEPEPLPAQYDALWAEVRELPRRQAQVIALHYIFDLDVVGIAATSRLCRGDGQGAPVARSSGTGPPHGPDLGEVMSIDDLAREAAADARRQAVQRVDTGSMLGQLHRMRRTRNIASVVSVLGLVAVVLLGGGLLARQYDTASIPLPPATQPTPTASAARSIPNDGCSDEVVTCLGDDRYHLALQVPVTVTVPGNFDSNFNVWDTTSLEVYRNDFKTVGVTVLESPVPVLDDGSATRDVSAGSTAEAQAAWLAQRPFLGHTHVTRTTLDGRTAWRVTGTLKPGAKLTTRKTAQMVAPTFFGGTAKAGYWPGLVAEYTLVDVPGSGVTVIWSWAVYEHSRVLRANQPLIDSMHFGP